MNNSSQLKWRIIGGGLALLLGANILVPVLRAGAEAADAAPGASSDRYRFDRTISREVLENYLSRAITMEGLLNGRGDLDDNVRMLTSTGAKFIGRSLCLWGGEANLLNNLRTAKEQSPKLHAVRPGDDPAGLYF